LRAFVAVATSQPLAALASQSVKPALHAKLHAPAAQVAAALAKAHARPHIPQCITVVRVSTSQPFAALSSQLAKLASQRIPQVPDAHVRVVFERSGHAIAQVPQWVTEVMMSTQEPAHRVSAVAHPEMQVRVPLTTLQTGAAPPHEVPQRPQLAGAVRSASQPFNGFMSQSAKPVVQAIPHVPAAQVVVELARSAHALPHRPQLPVVPRSVSQPFMGFMSQSAKPVAQVIPQRPVAHTAVALAPDGHCPRQAPQWASLVAVLASQPFMGSSSQSAKPVAHARVHRPAVQVAVALGRAAHSLPHAPQCITTVEVSVSHPLEATASQLPWPTLHAATAHWPPTQPGVPLAIVQTRPHAPQFMASVWTGRQLLTQHDWPCGHTCRSLHPGTHACPAPHTDPAGHWSSRVQATHTWRVWSQVSVLPPWTQAVSVSQPSSHRPAAVQYCSAAHEPRSVLVHATHTAVAVLHTRSPCALDMHSALVRQPIAGVSAAMTSMIPAPSPGPASTVVLPPPDPPQCTRARPATSSARTETQLVRRRAPHRTGGLSIGV